MLAILSPPLYHFNLVVPVQQWYLQINECKQGITEGMLDWSHGLTNGMVKIARFETFPDGLRLSRSAKCRSPERFVDPSKAQHDCLGRNRQSV